MLNDTKALYNNLEKELASITTTDKEYIKSIFAEIVILKGAEEIKLKAKSLIYKYLALNRTLAKDIITTDSNMTPREWKKMGTIFCAICDKEHFDSAETIISSRHNASHSTTIQGKIPFDDLKRVIGDAESFLISFEKFIQKEENEFTNAISQKDSPKQFSSLKAFLDIFFK
jgi:hypothetical protein